MTEAEWRACTDPTLMVRYLTNPDEEACFFTDRKARLVACAFCHQVLPLITTDWGRSAVELADAFAEGQATREHVEQVIEESYSIEQVGDCCEKAFFPTAECVPFHTLRSFRAVNMSLSVATEMGRGAAKVRGLDPFNPDADQSLLNVLREFFGNPFRTAPENSSWITPDMHLLATRIYDQRTFDELPRLAKLLETAHWPLHDLVEHLRTTGPHYRGCWALDQLLGKE